LQLLRYRKHFACRSCRGGHLLLPVAAKVNKNAIGCESPLRRTLRKLNAVPAPHRRAPPNSRMAQTCGGTRRKRTVCAGSPFAIPLVQDLYLGGFGVRPGPANCCLAGVYDDLRVGRLCYVLFQKLYP
jgi:hypothetical protein